MGIYNYNPNTGKKLSPGEVVFNKQTGKYIKQGMTFGSSVPAPTPQQPSTQPTYQQPQQPQQPVYQQPQQPTPTTSQTQIYNYNPNTGKKLSPGEVVFNKQTGQYIKQGMTFGSSVPAPTTAQTTQPTSYKIQSGDTLSALARKYGTTVSALMAANPQITDPNKIYAGANLNIPGATTPTQQPSQQPSQQPAQQPSQQPGQPLTPQQQLDRIKQQALQIQQALAQIPPEYRNIDLPSDLSLESIGYGGATPTITPAEIPAIPEVKDLTTGNIPTLPTYNEAPTTSYLGGLTQELTDSRATLDKMYRDQIASLQAQKDDSQRRIEELTAKQEGVMEEDIKPLVQPFREALEKSERERLKLEENYFANQRTVEELQSLLTQGQSDIEAAEAVTGLTAIRSPRIAKIKQDIAARAGILQASISARNGQINMAMTLIDRSKQAIEADRQGQIAYYEGLLNFYEGQKGTEEGKLLTITKEQKDMLHNQIELIHNDMARSQATYDYIKQMMLDPQTADIMEQSGVTLNDSIARIQQKFSNYSYQQEVKDVHNTFEAEGYAYLPLPSQYAGKPESELVRFVDSRGQERVYWKKEEEAKSTAIIEMNGRQVLIDSRTGNVIKDLGVIPSGTTGGTTGESGTPWEYMTPEQKGNLTPEQIEKLTPEQQAEVLDIKLHPGGTTTTPTEPTKPWWDFLKFWK